MGETSDDGVLKPLVGWSYPFVMRANGTNLHCGIASLGRAQGGNFPLCANGLVHGGIHFDEGTAGTIRQDDGVRVIADGEVVAYRLDDRYPRLTYPDGQKLLYSSSFVLVRHRLALARAKGVSGMGASDASATRSPDDTLDFFSLYMHLQDWKGYAKTAAGEKTPSGASKARHMPFWKGTMRYRVTDTANDVQAHRKVKKGARAAAISNVGNVSAGVSGTRDEVTPEIRRGIRVRQQPRGEILGLLPQGAEFAAERCPVDGWVQINGIAADMMLPYFVGGTADTRAMRGYVYVEALEEMIVPSPLDSVVVLDKPYRIKAGQVIGYVGEYQVCKDATPLPAKPRCEVLHLEVFAGDQLSEFLEKSRAYANTASGEDKTRLRVMAGARLVSQSDADETVVAGILLQATQDSPKDGAWAKVQPMRSAPRRASGSARVRGRVTQGRPLWVERRLNNTITTTETNAWRTFPLQAAAQKDDPVAFEEIFSRDRLENQADANQARDATGVQWWRVAMTGASTKNICGWVCENGHAGTRWESPWAWSGFTVVDNTAVSMVDMYKRGCHVSGGVFSDEATDCKRAALEVGNTPLIEQIERAIGQREKLQGRVSRLDLSVAMRDPCIATNISRIIVRNENEWGGGMDKWEALSMQMRAKSAIWETEMVRIKRLQWWSDAQSILGFPTSAVVHHIHPLGLIENFIDMHYECAIRFERIAKIILSHEGGYSDDPVDSGGKTNHGIAWRTWQAFAEKDLGVEPSVENLKNLTEEQAKVIFLKRYWEPRGFCQIENERLALMIYDWTITSGGAISALQYFMKRKYGVESIKRGVMDKGFRFSLNSFSNQADLLLEIGNLRKDYYHNAVERNPENQKFINGWINRVDKCLAVKS